MGKKIERSFTRKELADYLAELSEQLRRGSLEADGRLWTVPEQVYAKFGLKEVDDAIVAKISWQWSTSNIHYVVKEKPAGTPAQAPAPPQSASLKDVKVRLGASFKNLQHRLGEGLLPDAPMMQKFVEDSRTFADFVRPEWRQPMAEFLTHLENLQRAVDDQQLEISRQELRNLADCMTSCHREFK